MRRLRFRDTSGESTFDLNLAPMMDMMVSIIPFMLLSATFLQLNIINSPLPVPVAKALEQDRKNKNDVSIKVQMTATKDFVLEIKDEGGKVTKLSVPRKSASDYDFVGFHKKLVEIKQKHPKVFRLELNPDTNVDYRAIVATMDSSRSMENADPKVMIENAATPLLFPDVILANVMNE